MIRYLRDLRLLPIAVIACACLLALMVADFLLDQDSSIGSNSVADVDPSVIHATPDRPEPSTSMLSWASQMFNFPDGSGTAPASAAEPGPSDKADLDITGSVPDARPPDAMPPAAKPAATLASIDPQGQPSGAERAILERLQERRQELDARARELDIRESLIQAAEKRMAGQLAELKETEQRIEVATQQKDDAQTARFKGLITMYENMKPRDAAKIFDRLEIGVLIEMAAKIEPRHMADIMAQMSPDTAQRLTVELASKAQDGKPGGGGPNDLPKIAGQPTSQ
jgi:flagellar motility protein MotE (MotC chaperone)